MGAASSSGGGSGRDNTGPDQGFFISQSKKPSGLSKKNQDLVDSSFEDRGAVKIKNSKFKTPATAILSKPLQAGSKVTRKFFTDKVLGSKNFKGQSKTDFLSMSAVDQEKQYKSYIDNRTSGKTDAYGNVNQGYGRDNDGNVQTQKVVGGQTILVKEPTVEETKKAETEKTKYDQRVTKKKGRSKTIKTGSLGVTRVASDYSLGKPTLLGKV